MDRRQFNALLALGATGMMLEAPLAHGAVATRTVLYTAIGADLIRYDFDEHTGELTRGETITLPSAIQYVWRHPSNRWLYATTSDAPGGSVNAGTVHRLCALAVGPGGVLSLHGEPVVLTQRPIHNSVDGAGRFVLVAYNAPAKLTIHPIAPDGTLHGQVAEPEGLDLGIFPHQVRTLPANRSLVLVTRGNNAYHGRPEDPGALKLFRFDAGGRIAPLETVQVGGHGGLGYGPRHLDFHPRLPFAYVALERENQLHTHRIVGDRFVPEPVAIRSTIQVPTTAVTQMACAIHVHPDGHTVYVSNRSSPTVDFQGQKVFGGGENSIAVYRIDPNTGVPTQIQAADPRAFHVRAFGLSPSGRWLVAASLLDMNVRDGDHVRAVPAGLTVFRIEPDGRLTFRRKYDTPVGDRSQVWTALVTVPG
jgi:6-phosphogluconolactonase